MYKTLNSTIQTRMLCIEHTFTSTGEEKPALDRRFCTYTTVTAALERIQPR